MSYLARISFAESIGYDKYKPVEAIAVALTRILDPFFQKWSFFPTMIVSIRELMLPEGATGVSFRPQSHRVMTGDFKLSSPQEDNISV